LDLEEPDREAFPALDIAYEAGRQGGSSPATLNAADEVAVEAFLQGRLGFLGITEVVSQTVESIEWREVTTVDEVLDVDREARAIAVALAASAC
jgi:1-deoxy-D-xylulose-5-phosphate reductoisomerase